MMRRVEINRMSAKRRAALAAQGIHHPGSTLIVRKPLKAKTSNSTPGSDLADAVLERDSYSCVVCGENLYGPRGEAWSIHHRVRRSQGVDNQLSNLVAVCGGARMDGCHQQIHSQITKAREDGWLLRRGEDPQAVPLAHSQRGWVRLLNDGKAVKVA